MPSFNIYNSKTGKTITTEIITFSELERLLKTKGADWIQSPSAPAICDPVHLGITRPPEDFMRNVLGKIKDKHPLGNVEKRFHIPREW